MPAGASNRLLRAAVAVASLVPISGGALGLLDSLALLGPSAAADLDSHFRYLSGLLLAIGLAYAASIRDIENHRSRFLLLGSIVVVGGLGRLLSVMTQGGHHWPTYAALVMELGVTPALTAWQNMISHAGRG